MELAKMVKLVNSQARVTDKGTESARVKDFMVRHRQNRFKILFFHDDMAGSLAVYAPACSMEGLNCFSARAITGEFWHLYSHLTEDMVSVEFFVAFSAFVKDLKTAIHCIFNIFEGFLFCVALRDAARNSRTFSDVPVYFARLKDNFIFHSLLPPLRSIAYREMGVKHSTPAWQRKRAGTDREVI